MWLFVAMKKIFFYETFMELHMRRWFESSGWHPEKIDLNGWMTYLSLLELFEALLEFDTNV